MQENNYDLYKLNNNSNMQCFYNYFDNLIIHINNMDPDDYFIKKEKLLKNGFVLKSENYDDYYNFYDAIFKKEIESDYKNIINNVINN